MKRFKLLETDFYQLTMAFIYVCENLHKNYDVGFEAFCRNINPKVTDENYYLMHNSYFISNYINKITEEIKDPEFLETFIKIIEPKIKNKEHIELFRKNWDVESILRFSYCSLNNNSKIYPFMPYFQYWGNPFIGQIIETMILNMTSGAIGEQSKKIKGEDFDPFYQNELIRHKAIEYRNSTTKILLEAGFRRAYNHRIANMASIISLNCGFNGTSNTSIGFDDETLFNYINGTCAHSLIMLLGEETAFKVWDKYFPKSTILVDTYDVLNAVGLLIKNNIKPNDVRIDSEPLEDYAVKVRKLLDDVGWIDVKIYLSGDLTPERLRSFNENNIPYDKCMVGTKYVNIGDFQYYNAGMIYKLVQVRNIKTREFFYPEKKSTGKINYSGLKRYDTDRVTENGKLILKCKTNNTIPSIIGISDVKYDGVIFE